MREEELRDLKITPTKSKQFTFRHSERSDRIQLFKLTLTTGFCRCAQNDDFEELFELLVLIKTLHLVYNINLCLNLNSIFLPF